MSLDFIHSLGGIVFYNSRGLPQRMFSTGDRSIRWTEKSFQALHLQECLGEILQLPPLHYAYLELQGEKILLVKQEEGYIACLWEGGTPPLSEEMLTSLQNLTPTALQDCPQLVSL